MVFPITSGCLVEIRLLQGRRTERLEPKMKPPRDVSSRPSFSVVPFAAPQFCGAVR